MAFAVCIVLFLDPRVRIVRGNPVAYHETYCSRRADVAFFRGRVQLGVAQWSTADRVDICFRGSKGDQLRKGAVVSRVQAGSPRPVEVGGGAVDLMIELMSCYLLCPRRLPWWRMTVVVADGPCGRSNKRR